MKSLGLLLRGFGVAGILLLAAPIILLRLAILLAIGLFAATILNWMIVATLHPLLGTSFPADMLKWLLFGGVYLMGIATPLLIWADMSGLSAMLRVSDRHSHGSARFATRKERVAFEGGDGLLIGRDLDTGKLLRYDGPAHLLTLAPTRAGKGVGTVIPNLFLAERSVLVIDPKGENAKIAGEARKRFGAVHILSLIHISEPTRPY